MKVSILFDLIFASRPYLPEWVKVHNKTVTLNKITFLASPELTANFAEEEADSQEAEGGRSAENTSPVVMQILPQTTCESLKEHITQLLICMLM